MGLESVIESLMSDGKTRTVAEVSELCAYAIRPHSAWRAGEKNRQFLRMKRASRTTRPSLYRDPVAVGCRHIVATRMSRMVTFGKLKRVAPATYQKA